MLVREGSSWQKGYGLTASVVGVESASATCFTGFGDNGTTGGDVDETCSPIVVDASLTCSCFAHEVSAVKVFVFEGLKLLIARFLDQQHGVWQRYCNRAGPVIRHEADAVFLFFWK